MKNGTHVPYSIDITQPQSPPPQPPSKKCIENLHSCTGTIKTTRSVIRRNGMLLTAPGSETTSTPVTNDIFILINSKHI